MALTPPVLPILLPLHQCGHGSGNLPVSHLPSREYRRILYLVDVLSRKAVSVPLHLGRRCSSAYCIYGNRVCYATINEVYELQIASCAVTGFPHLREDVTVLALCARSTLLYTLADEQNIWSGSNWNGGNDLTPSHGSKSAASDLLFLKRTAGYCMWLMERWSGFHLLLTLSGLQQLRGLFRLSQFAVKSAGRLEN